MEQFFQGKSLEINSLIQHNNIFRTESLFPLFAKQIAFDTKKS